MTQAEVAPATSPVEIPPAADSDEAQLTREVGALWQMHAQTKATVIKSRAEMNVIRTDLSRRMHELKALLSKPGRGGAWSGFLAAEKISRSTADRLVRAHEKTLARQVNCANEHITEPSEVIVHKYLHALWPKLSRVLTTQESVEMFVDELRSRAKKSFNTTPPAAAGA